MGLNNNTTSFHDDDSSSNITEMIPQLQQEEKVDEHLLQTGEACLPTVEQHQNDVALFVDTSKGEQTIEADSCITGLTSTRESSDSENSDYDKDDVKVAAAVTAAAATAAAVIASKDDDDDDDDDDDNDKKLDIE